MIGFSFLLFLSSFFQYNRIKDLKYIFTDDSIIVSKSGTEKKFLLSEIEDIRRPNHKNVKKSGIDYIEFKFRDGQKIILDNALPGFIEINDFVVPYLRDKLDYIIRKV